MRPLVFGSRLRLPSVLVAALALGLGAWIAGCDFTRVDEGTDLPLQQHLEALATASTPDQAELAIRGVFNKVGVRTSWQADVPDADLAFGTYFVSDQEIEALAEKHAQFVQNRAGAATIAETHAAVLVAEEEATRIIREMQVGVTRDNRGAIRVDPREASAILGAAVTSAAQSPELPRSAMVLAITADGAAISSAVPTSARTLSPVQSLLYSIWLHQNGPFMYPFLSEEGRLASEAAARTSAASCDIGQSCDACCDGSGKFVSITLQYLGPPAMVKAIVAVPSPKSFTPFPETSLVTNQLFSVDGDNRVINPGGKSSPFDGTIGNELDLFVGTTQFAAIHTSCSVVVSPGMIFGSTIGGTYYGVRVVAVATQNGGRCTNLQECVGACRAQLLSCQAAAAGNEAALQTCAEQFRSCDLNCHDQGGLY